MIKLDQIGINWIKLDLIGLNLTNLVQPCSNLIKLDWIGSNLIKLNQIGSNLIKLLKLEGGGLSPTPTLSFALLSLIIEKLGLSLYCLKIFKLVHVDLSKRTLKTIHPFGRTLLEYKVEWCITKIEWAFSENLFYLLPTVPFPKLLPSCTEGKKKQICNI